jgi:hypothetical protein
MRSYGKKPLSVNIGKSESAFGIFRIEGREDDFLGL